MSTISYSSIRTNENGNYVSDITLEGDTFATIETQAIALSDESTATLAVNSEDNTKAILIFNPIPAEGTTPVFSAELFSEGTLPDGADASFTIDSALTDGMNTDVTETFDSTDESENGEGDEAVVEQIIFTGTESDEELAGNENDNVLMGLLGSNTLTGGAGSDIFIVNGADAITDFSADEDILIVRPNATATIYVDGVMNSFYTVTPSDKSLIINSLVQLSDLENSLITFTPNHTGIVTITDNTPATASTVGDVLTAKDTLEDANGIGEFTYQWLSNGVAVGKNTATYTLAASDVGKLVSVEVSYVDGKEYSESQTSTATAKVVAAAANALDHSKATAADTIIGTAGADTVIASPKGSVITGANGVDKITLGAVKDVLKYTATTAALLKTEANDALTSFTSGSDKIQLVKAFGTAFKGTADAAAPTTALKATDFIAAKTTKIAADLTHGGRFIFNATTKTLSFDPKGDDTSAAVGGTIVDTAKDDFVVLTGVTALVAADFILA